MFWLRSERISTSSIRYLIILSFAKYTICIMNNPADPVHKSRADSQPSNLWISSAVEDGKISREKIPNNFMTEPSDNLDYTSSIRIEAVSKNLTGKSGELIYFLVKNDGKEDEYIRVNVSDQNGYAREIPPTEFLLPSQSTKEILVRMDYNDKILSHSPDIVTVQARGKLNSVVKRSAFYPESDYLGRQNGPLCYDRYVTGNCRYRTDPEYCFQYEWTAYATVQNSGGLQSLSSIPTGLYVPPTGTNGRVRVWVKNSCCTPFVQIISSDPRLPFPGNSCIIDVRELQGLHPGEIAGIVIAAVFLVIVIIGIIFLIMRKRRAQTTLQNRNSVTICLVDPKPS